MDAVTETAITIITHLTQGYKTRVKELIIIADPDDVTLLKECQSRLHLWTSSFNEEKLELILAASRDIRVTILMLLREVGKTLQAISNSIYLILPLERANVYVQQSHQDDLLLLEFEEEDCDEDSSYSSDNSNLAHNPVIERLDRHLRLLLRLLPTMERILVSTSPEQKHSAVESRSRISRVMQNSTVQDFCDFISRLSRSMVLYDRAPYENGFRLIPLESLQKEAQDEMLLTKNLGAVAVSWDKEDCVYRAFLRWFCNEFFSFDKRHPCIRCQSPTQFLAMDIPSEKEIPSSVLIAEIRVCIDPKCHYEERLPLHWNVQELLKTRRGSASEGTLCFYVLCRAMGAKIRWVWCPEHTPWLEIYSEDQTRWIHLDPFNELWDRPSVYLKGWHMRLSYCIAFSEEGAFDVISKYAQGSDYTLPWDQELASKLLRTLLQTQVQNGQSMATSDEMPHDLGGSRAVHAHSGRPYRGKTDLVQAQSSPKKNTGFSTLFGRSKKRKNTDEAPSATSFSVGSSGPRSSLFSGLSSSTTYTSNASTQPDIGPLPKDLFLDVSGDAMIPCRQCGLSATRFMTRLSNRNGNAGRSYWKCVPCSLFICWDESIDVKLRNPVCNCGAKTRTDTTRHKPSKTFYSCATGNCDFFQWSTDLEGDQQTIHDDVADALRSLTLV